MAYRPEQTEVHGLFELARDCSFTADCSVSNPRTRERMSETEVEDRNRTNRRF